MSVAEPQANHPIGPIIGLATGSHFYPVSEPSRLVSLLHLLLQSTTLLLWMAIFAAILKDRHYQDANNLLVISFAMADVVLAATSCHSATLIVRDGGYSGGYIGIVLSLPLSLISTLFLILLNRVYLGSVFSNCRVYSVGDERLCHCSRSISPHVSWIFHQLGKDGSVGGDGLDCVLFLSRNHHLDHASQLYHAG